MRWLSVVGLLTVWLAAGDGMAAVKTWVVGTEQRPWAQSGKITAFDEVSGALQSREYKPYQNILQGLDKRDNEGKTIWLPEGAWQRWHVDFDYVLGEDPRSSYTHQHPFFLDGDPEIGYAALEPARTYKGVRYLFDTGVLVPANRFVFYPQQTGILPRTGVPLREYYMRAYQVSATAKLSQERLTGWGTDPLEVLLGEEPHNFKHVPVIDFPLQPLRVFQLTNLALTGFSLGEIELYGEGFAPEAWYTTEVIDLGAPVNIGRVSWDFKKFRWRKQWQWIGPSSSEELRLQTRAAPELWQVIGGDPEPIEWPQAPVSISVEVRTGTDDTPLVYHKMGELGNEIVVTKKEYLKLERIPRVVSEDRPILPEMRGSVTYDDEHWTRWVSVTSSGQGFFTPGSRRYIQFRVKVKSEDPWAFGRLDSLWVEYSPPLTKQVVGEVCVEGELTPPKGITEVEAGRLVALLYALQASFDSPDQGGFDAVRISVPSRAKFKGLWMGRPLQQVTPDRVEEGERQLEVYLPKKVTQRNNEPVRIAFETAVLSYGTQLSGEVWDTEGKDLPHQISPGDATDEIATDQLQVLVVEESFKHLTGVTVVPNVITPNDDGMNDYAQISHTLALVSGAAQVEIGIYDLSGHRVRMLAQRQEKSTYARQDRWDGRDEDGKLVPPGLYLCRIQAITDAGRFERVRPITVIY